MTLEGKEAISKQVTGNIGLYYCCYQLSLRGWNVMPTARNAVGVDIIAYNEDVSKFVGLQVKALSGENNVSIGISLSKIISDFWIIVDNVRDNTKRAAYILKADEVCELAGKKGDKYWLEQKEYKLDQFCNCWERIQCVD